MSPSRRPELQRKLRDIPHRPGVYLHKDRLGGIIYVGKARNLRKRLSSYFSPSRQRTADHKTRALIESIWDFEIREVRNEEEALVLEEKLIKEYRPKYNVLFRDDKRFLLLKIHLEEPWPRFQLTRLRKEDGATYFGPYPHANALRETVEWLNRRFGLRACRPMRPDEKDHKHCHFDILKNCTAPCVGRITREDYLALVQQACAFLRGQSKELLQSVEEEMAQAAAALDFEKAGALRDMIENLKKTLKPVRQFTRKGLPGPNIHPEEDVRELQEFLGLEHPPLVMECFDISNISSNHIVASMVRFQNGLPDNANYRRYRIKTVQGQDDFASMAEVIRRRYSRVLLEAHQWMDPDDAATTQENPLDAMRRLETGPPPAAPPQGRKKVFVRLPDLVIVDGGKGQLGMAARELQRLGLHGLPVVGLAKQREEIFFPEQSEPLLIPHETGALKLLQRIRDEAHRVANGYHQLLMKRRIQESILDDCPGISRKRKENLLKKFGSVTRMRKASADDFAEVAGISKSLASEIVLFLKTH